MIHGEQNFSHGMVKINLKASVNMLVYETMAAPVVLLIYDPG